MFNDNDFQITLATFPMKLQRVYQRESEASLIFSALAYLRSPLPQAWLTMGCWAHWSIFFCRIVTLPQFPLSTLLIYPPM